LSASLADLPDDERVLLELLGAVRGRRRRRIAIRVATAAVLLLFGYWPFADVATTGSPANPGIAVQVAPRGSCAWQRGCCLRAVLM
jgi:hypothetical protein